MEKKKLRQNIVCETNIYDKFDKFFAAEERKKK